MPDFSAAITRAAALLAALLCLLPSSASLVSISNTVPRVDTLGRIVNAHDGNLVFLNGLYHLYGTVYEDCLTTPVCDPNFKCGFHPNRFALYTSPDLQRWALESDNVLPSVAADNANTTYWMPVVHQRADGVYVMQFWSHHCGFNNNRCVEVAFALAPAGPFVNVTRIPLAASVSSTMGFFKDYDGSAYIKWNTRAPDNHHAIQKLTADWAASTDEVAVLLWKPSFAWNEGGGMFRRGSLYYYVTGTDCCFCAWGADSRWLSSHAAMGPWHPGLAPPLPTQRCSLDGEWLAAAGAPDAGGNFSLLLSQAEGSDNFTSSTNGTGWVDQGTGYVHLHASGLGDARGVVTSVDGSAAGCDRVRWYGAESFMWCRRGAACAQPRFSDAPELNPCAGGAAPSEGVQDNPCDPGHQLGRYFTIPAQMYNVALVPTVDAAGLASTAYLYYGERYNTGPDGLMSHGFSALVPFAFDQRGALLPLGALPDFFQLNITNATQGQHVG